MHWLLVTNVTTQMNAGLEKRPCHATHQDPPPAWAPPPNQLPLQHQRSSSKTSTGLTTSLQAPSTSPPCSKFIGSSISSSPLRVLNASGSPKSTPRAYKPGTYALLERHVGKQASTRSCSCTWHEAEAVSAQRPRYLYSS
eukprot:1134250-Pelagomonas_calceolata.AAC.9